MQKLYQFFRKYLRCIRYDLLRKINSRAIYLAGKRPAAECCERSEQCIEAPAGQHGRFDTIFATQKSLSDLRCARDGSGYARAARRRPAVAAGRPAGATSAMLAGQERAACAFERTARRRRLSMPPGEPKAMNGGLCERERRGAQKTKKTGPKRPVCIRMKDPGIYPAA